jgi:uncharacterized CHY-type Zn-finger protein
MPTTIACPVCQTCLTFMPTAMAVGCPYCRVALRFTGGAIPVGHQVCCGKCHGVFTAEVPPLSLRMPAATFGLCPTCQIALKVPSVIPQGKTIKCPQCQQKFMPSALLHDPSLTPIVEDHRSALPTAAPPRATTKSAPKTQLSIRKSGGKSKTQLAPPAALPSADVPLFDLPSADTPSSDVPLPVPAEMQVDPLLPPEHDVDDEDVLVDVPAASSRLIGPEAVDNGLIPDTNRVAAPPPPRPVRRRPALKPVAEPDPAALPKPAPKRPRPAPAESREPTRPSPTPKAPTRAAKQDVPALAARNVSATAEAVADPLPAPSLVKTEPMATRLLDGPSRKSGPRIDVGPVLIIVVIAAILGGGAYLAYSLIPWGGGRRTVFPTEGMVFYKGKPAVGAVVTLIPEDKRDHYFPWGKVREDGSFRLTTYEPDDGAPAGRYKVTISRGQTDADEYAELRNKLGDQEAANLVKKRARDPLFDRYLNPRNSGLTAEITSQPLNKLETFQLN